MKNFLFLLLCLPFTVAAQKQSAVKNKTVTVVCKLIAAPANMDSITVYDMAGLAMRIVGKGGRRASDSAFVVVVPAGKPRFYGIGLYENAAAKVLLGEEPELTLWAHAGYMDKGRIVGSPVNKAFENVQKQAENFKTQSQELRTQFFNGGDEAAIKATTAKIKALAKAKTQFLDSVKIANPLLWRMATVLVSPEYVADKAGAQSEIDFYGKESFRYANLTDKGYEEIPDVFNAFDNYVQRLLMIGATPDQTKQFIELQLAKMPAESRTYRVALGGVVNGLKASNSQLYPMYGTKYTNQYRSNTWGEIGRVDFDMRKSGTNMVGFEAPELVGLTPDSTMYSLSSLRGKIVMIDFWASWCGPCRRENPNVVANYKKYHDKGFDILGVSLDREATSWKNAITQDGLPWHHISDLKGWQSAHAQLYSISSIPATILLDREGKIIAKNLRGPELEAKLKEIFEPATKQ